LVSRTQKELDLQALEIEKLGQQVLTFKGDITVEEDVINLFNAVKEKHGHLDILVNNAGTSFQAKAEEVDLKLWDKTINLNNRALFHCCQMAGKMMISQKSGKIINISSHLGIVGLPKRVVYCTSKAAVIHLTKTLAAEWAEYGINVNCIAPGYTMTKLARKVLDNIDFKKIVLNNIPLKFIGNTEDIAGAAVYLASEASRYMTGQTLVIDGGWSCV